MATVTTDEARERIRAFLCRHTGPDLADTDDYFALGMVNSLFAMQLVVFVQKEFGLTLGPQQMVFDNFRTVNGLVRLVGDAS
ncbi:acyl carrier protein [Actinophytocola oryzae]|uniref:Acyl carrier protein n=1 Tax=Actinophytocola oryzae TaxID=502181 RepID=A0A4R7VKQ8_9PSEU|nr:acyl carrier protein [Actinophytocola oryzae]TDV49788.1 acyl carrier protein [Actinophytocola oryzae]